MDQGRDTELLTRWRAGDQEAFAVLVARYQGLVLAACRRQAEPGSVDDCAQAVFLVLARRPQAALRAPALAAWLQRVSSFVCQRSRRAAGRRRRAELAAAVEAADRGPRPPAEALAHLDDCLLRLPERQRAALVLHFLAGLGPGEVAARLGTSRENAYKLLDRGLAGLRAALAGRGFALGAAALAGLLAGEGAAAVATPTGIIAVIIGGGTSPTPAAASLASGALTTMKTAALLPVAAAAAALVLTAGLLTAVLAAEPGPAPAAQTAGRGEWTARCFADVVAAAGPLRDDETRLRVLRLGEVLVDLPPGRGDPRRDLELAAWQVGCLAFDDRLEPPSGPTVHGLGPLVGGTRFTKLYDLGDLCRGGDGAGRREALRVLAAAGGSTAALFADVVAIDGPDSQHLRYAGLIRGLRSHPDPGDGDLLFQDGAAPADGAPRPAIFEALGRPFQGPLAGDPSIRRILTGLRREGVPVLVQSDLAHLDEPLRPAPAAGEANLSVLRRATEALSATWSVDDGEVVCIGTTVPASQRWRGRWFRTPTGRRAGTTAEFAACLALALSSAGAAAPWGEGVLVFAPEPAMATCEGMARALRSHSTQSAVPPATGF